MCVKDSVKMKVINVCTDERVPRDGHVLRKLQRCVRDMWVQMKVVNVCTDERVPQDGHELGQLNRLCVRDVWSYH